MKKKTASLKLIFTKERRNNLRWIAIGTLLVAIASNLFYAPANMVPGGFTGLAIIIRKLTEPWIDGGMPVWMGNLILNVPLIVAAIAVRGWAFMRRTFFATLLFSGWLYIIPEYTLIADDYLLVAIFGGGIMGLGLGFVLFGKATTGGTDTLAALLQRLFPHISVAHFMPLLDGAVILLSMWIFGIRISLYAVISVIICGILADRVVSGMKNAYTAYIISDDYAKIGQQVMRELDRGVTALDGTGLFTGQGRQVLMCAISKKQVADLREIVCTIDPDAFMILTESREIRGEGFLRFSREEL